MFSFFAHAAISESDSSSDDDGQVDSRKNVVVEVGTTNDDSPVMSTQSNNENENEIVSTFDVKESCQNKEVSIDHDSDSNDATLPLKLSDSTPSKRVDSDLLLKVESLEENNRKMTKQLSTLQGIITSKSALYLEYKQKYEVSMRNMSLFAHPQCNFVHIRQAKKTAYVPRNSPLTC